MKTAEIKTVSSSNHSSKMGQPFFQKEGESAFFSEAQQDIQTKPFFDVANAPFDSGIHRIQPQVNAGANTLADPQVLETDRWENGSIAAPAVQTKCAECEQEEQEQVDQAKPVFESETEPSEKEIQTKPSSANNGLRIGQPNDKYEQEADAMADLVLQKLSEPKEVTKDKDEEVTSVIEPEIQKKTIFESEAAEVSAQTKPGTEPIHSSDAAAASKISTAIVAPMPAFQAKCEDCEQEEKEEMIKEQAEVRKTHIFGNQEETPQKDNTIQKKCTDCAQEDKILKKSEHPDQEEHLMTKSESGRPSETHNLKSKLDSSKGSGEAMPKDTQSSMESAFGTDFNQVRIHTGSEATKMNKELHAKAFTHGHDIYFNEGKYDENSIEGKRLLAHELTHIVQQTGMVHKEDDCTSYGTGEVTQSRNAAGWLDPDVILISTGNLLLADFPIGRSNVRSSITSNILWQTHLTQFESDCAFRLMIIGYSDCIGEEARNITLRQQRATKVEQLFGTSTRPRISFRGMAGLGEYVVGNDSPENRAKNRSAKIEFKKGFFAQYESVANAIASDIKIQEALNELSLSSEPREKNVPDYIRQESITLEPLTPKHDSDITTPRYDFFTGKVDYSNSINLPNTVRFHTYNTRRNVAIQARALPCVDNFLPLTQIKERIVQAITEIVHLNAAGTGPISTFEIYRSKFHGWWHIEPYASMSNFFDPTLDSKGPRTPKSREIFETIYTDDASVKIAYDLNSSGIREKIDTYLGPDALNLINSPRLHNLKEAFDLYTSPVASADYAAFKTSIQTAAANLDSNDIIAFNSSGEWQRLIVRYLAAESQRTEIINIIRTSTVVPAPPPPPSPPPSGGGGGSARVFLNNIRIDGPSAPISANNQRERVTLTPKSNRANPGLSFSTKFTVTPAVKVVGSNVSPVSLWANASDTGVSFDPEITVNGTASMNAHLDLEGLPAGLGAGPTVPDFPFTINDNRQAHLLSIWGVDFKVNTPSGDVWFSSGPTVRYQHGAQDFGVSAVLNATYPNPGLTLSINSRIKRGSTVIASNSTPQPWPSGSWFSPPISLTFAPPSPFPVGGDNLTVEADLLDSGGVVIGTKSRSVTVLAPATYTQAEAEKMAREDHAHLNSNAFLNLMSAQGGLATRVATAIRATEADGGITLRPITIRHDSAAFVALRMGAPDPTRVGWFLGTTYANSAAWRSGAAAMSITPRFGFGHLGRRLIVANRTTDVANKLRRDDLTLIPLIVHEAIHALDLPDSTADIYKYKTEFRSYWVDGRYGPPNQATCPSPPGNCKEAVFKPDIIPPTPGPKSPRAREIFNHLYGNNSYAFVKPAYDNNVGGFRDMVDNYLIPDGINLVASIRLERLRLLIDGYSGANFANLRTNVRRLMGKEVPAPPGGVLDVEEKHEINSTRAWRDLVDSKFPVAAERNVIKNDLEIPL